MNATLELRSWLRRRLWVETPEGLFIVEYSGRGLGYESVWINDMRAPGPCTGAWFVPRFDFDLCSACAAVEVRVWPWLTIRSFHLVVAGEVLYSEGSRCLRRAEESAARLRRATRRLFLSLDVAWELRLSQPKQPRRILFESLDWEYSVPTREVIDLAEPSQVVFLLTMFATGNYAEARVVGETAEAIETFRAFVQRGGYEPASTPPTQSQLYRRGDEVYPQPEAFVFVCPTPDPQVANRIRGYLSEAR